MLPENNKFEYEQSFVERLSYSPVPLEPLSATHPNTGKNYAETSSRHITRGWKAALHHAVESGWIDANDAQLIAQIDEYVESSLQSTQARRILHHASTRLDESVDRTDPRVQRALDARSTPRDNFDVLVDYPALREIELAKLSHGLDFSATEEMDAAVLEIILDTCTRLYPHEPRYKIESRNNDIPAALIVRKTPLAECDTKHGLVVITKRQTLLVRGDFAARGFDEVLDRRIKNPERFEELCVKIEGYMQYIDQIPQGDRTWLQPTTTSYYAAYADSDVEQISLF